MGERIYLDHAATTPPRPEVLEAMRLYTSVSFGNPSSRHSEGREARDALESARETVAACCGTQPDGVRFVSSGTEANSIALLGRWLAGRASTPSPHFVVSAIEHPSVLETCDLLESLGASITRVGVSGFGTVDPDAVLSAVTGDTVLVSVMAVNNETGAVQPVEAIGKRLRELEVPFHSDAVQWLGKRPLAFDAMSVDLLSVSAHKAGGPRGAAALLVRDGTELAAVTRGGGQEGGLKSGTENVAAAVGFAAALAATARPDDGIAERYAALRSELAAGLRARWPRCVVLSPLEESLPEFLALSFPWIKGEALVGELDRLGVSVSTGSACKSGDVSGSHVLRAMGRSSEEVAGALRLSFGQENLDGGVDGNFGGEILGRIVAAVERLETLSPLR